MAPQLYDLPELNRQMLTILGLPNVGKLVKDDSTQAPMDPVSENQAILTGKPVKAFLWQDQDAHIAVHMAAMQDPKMAQMVGQSPQASLINGSAIAHITEHLAYKYRKEIEKQMGVPLPPEGPLPPEVEVQLSKLVAEASAKLLQKDKAEAAQQQAQQQAQDPVLQLQQQELAVKQADVQRKKDEGQQKFTLDHAKLFAKTAMDGLRLQSQERTASAALGVKISETKTDTAQVERDQLLKAATELADLELRHKQLNNQDRQHGAQMDVQRAAQNQPNGAAPPAE